MTVVNKFNVNSEQVTLNPDIIENMSANDVSYNSSLQYGENTVGNKLSELESEIDVFKEDVTDEVDVFKEVVTEQVNNYTPIVINGNVTNAPDEEDLTSVDGLLKFKNRSALNGMGYVILRKNKSFAEQVTLSNTIYEIRYDFDLNDTEIIIPKNCILKFEGGSISNGCLYGNSTIIYAESYIIFKELEFKGIWNIPKVYPDWFGIIYNNESIDNTKAIKAAVLLSKQTIQHTIAFNGGDIWVNVITDKIITDLSDIDYSKNKVIELYNDCTILMRANTYIKIMPNASIQYSFIHGNNVNNIIIKGGHIIGDVKNHIGTTGEWGFGINFEGVTNSIIDNVECSYCWGDGIILFGYVDPLKTAIEDRWCNNIQIKRCTLALNRRNNLSICSANKVLVADCEIYSAGAINGTNPKNGICVEPWFETEKCNNLNFYNNRIYNNVSYQMQLYGCDSDNCPINITNVRIHNCDISYYEGVPFYQSVLPLWIRAKDVKITNSHICALLLEHSDRLTISNCHLGNLQAKKYYNVSALLKDINIDNCVFENNYGYFNQNSPIFSIETDVTSMCISNCICNSTTNAGLITYSENVTTNKNVQFISNIINTKYKTNFNGSTAINNIVKNPGNLCQCGMPYLYSFDLDKDELSEDYLVDLEVSCSENIYTIYIKSVWTDIQRIEFSKIVIHVGYITPILLESISYDSFVPISFAPVDSGTKFRITFAKSKPTAQIVFTGAIESQYPFEAKISSRPNTDGFRTPMTPSIPTVTVGQNLPSNPYLGQCCFYKNINKPVWWNGTKWTDATGADV